MKVYERRRERKSSFSLFDSIVVLVHGADCLPTLTALACDRVCIDFRHEYKKAGPFLLLTSLPPIVRLPMFNQYAWGMHCASMQRIVGVKDVFLTTRTNEINSKMIGKKAFNNTVCLPS